MNHLIRALQRLLSLTLASIALSTTSQSVAFSDDYRLIKQRVNQAIEVSHAWEGPILGPAIASQKQLVFVASDLRNDGVNSLAQGMTEAIRHLDWNLRLLDGNGSKIRQAAALNRAILLQPDGIILGGVDAHYHRKSLETAQAFGIEVIGWHAAHEAGHHPHLGLYTNITTDAAEVGDLAASLAVIDGNAQAQVVIFTDSNYDIATLKTNSMAKRIQACSSCRLLSIEDIPLDRIASEMPKTLERLFEQYPDQITHFLAINDLYIDFAIPSLNTTQQPPKSISAGDGSREAYQRISAGKHQFATVPEPLLMQGWQIVDEFNRAFNGQSHSGYRAPVHLVVQSNVNNIDFAVGVHDPANQYRDVYKRIWK